MPKFLPAATVELVAQRFRAMGEPVRLHLLMSLQDGERSVSELVERHHTSQANISKHLQVLARAGLVRRRKEGLNVYYAIADPAIYRMCDMVCGSLRKHLAAQAKAMEV